MQWKIAKATFIELGLYTVQVCLLKSDNRS